MKRKIYNYGPCVFYVSNMSEIKQEVNTLENEDWFGTVGDLRVSLGDLFMSGFYSYKDVSANIS